MSARAGEYVRGIGAQGSQSHPWVRVGEHRVVVGVGIWLETWKLVGQMQRHLDCFGRAPRGLFIDRSDCRRPILERCLACLSLLLVLLFFLLCALFCDAWL